MKYILDTNVIIDHMRSKYTLSPHFFVDGTCISVITEGELIYGAYKSNNFEKVVEQIDSFVKDFPIQILSIDSLVISVYARIRSELESEGKPVDQLDLLIAATAIAHSLILVTNNKKHFERIPDLQIYS